MNLYERTTLERRLRRLPRSVLDDLNALLAEKLSAHRRKVPRREIRGVPGDMRDLPPRLRGLVRREFSCETFDASTGRRCGR